MSALAKFLNLLADRIEDPDFERTFIPSILPQWELHREEAVTLLQDFEACMSPRRLFESSPLSDCDAEVKQWLTEFVHSLWLRRVAVRELVSAGISAVEKVDEVYLHLRRELERCPDVVTADNLKTLREDFAAFREQCQQLASAVEKLPNGIIVA